MKKLFNIGVGAVVALALIVGTVSAIAPSVKAQTVDNSPDCDSYSVMWCGAYTSNAIQNKYQNGDGHNSAVNIKSIFSNLGVSEAQVKAGGYVDGIVYQNGTVTVNGKVVAKNAQTYIRSMGTVSTSKMASAQTALVKLNADKQFEYAVMKPCGNPVKATNVVPKPPKPQPVQKLVCDKLILDKKDARKVTATVKASTTNGALITGYSIDFGDKTTVNNRTATHTYKADGTYTITGTVTGMVNGKKQTVGGANCKGKVTFKNAKPVCDTNPNLPVNDSKCNPETPEVPGETPPAEIPNTGAGGAVALFMGSSSISYMLYRFWMIRRLGM